MKELIEVKKNEELGINAVSARDLYLGLGLDKGQWSRWSKLNILSDKFFLNGNDYVGFDIVSSGNITKDYAISLEFAKHICMQARTDKSHEYRKYMIDCENKVISNLSAIPKNFAEALQLAADQAKEIELKDKQIEFKDDLIIASNEASIKAGDIKVSEFVKSSDLIDLGRNQFYQWMREQGILFVDSCEPIQTYVSRAYLKWLPTAEEHGGKIRYTLFITARGKVWLAAKYMKYLDNEQ